MAPVQSRLVLAVTVPAAALAILLSLFWLRRASKGHPPSPPDIPDKNNKGKQEPDKCERKSVVCSEIVETITDEDFVIDSSCESIDNISQIESEEDTSLLLKPDLFIGNGIKQCEEIIVQVRSVVQEEEFTSKVNLHLTSETEENLVSGDKLRPEKGPLEAEEKTSPDNIVISIENTVSAEVKSSPKEIELLPNLEETVVLPKSEETELCPKTEETTVTVKSKDNESLSPEQIVTSSTSEKKVSMPNQKSSIESRMITEEAASPVKLDFHKEAVIEKSDLSEKLANLELDTMKLGDVDIKERDSANHSPSENMLASPSMSNFSDAHSEGSSDSGKGHSDGTTSPSRTPAGGSSVAGDPTPSVYEFVIPQVIVGRLIGRHGIFLHEIMNETHTSIFIKVHPESAKLKICAIEGSQQDIEKALEKIRKKFPLRRYPKLTLEQVSFVPMPSSQQLRSEDFHLQLIEGVNNDVILSSLLSPGQFFVQQPCHPSYPCLTPLTQILTQAYSTTDAPPLVNPVSDAICVCPSLGGWYRAQIVTVDDDTVHCDIKFVDYGGYLRVEASLLKQIRADFLMLPFQAVECSLANIKPVHESGWSEEARLFVHNITFGRILQAQIVSYSETGIPLVNLYTGINAQVVLVNAELVSNGFAKFTTAEGEEENSETIPDQVTV